jgi:hypothetical protein
VIAAGSFGAEERASGSTDAACGTERWAVKTLTDPAAASVDFAHVHSSTIAKLGHLKAPSHPMTRTTREKRVYRVHAILDSIPGLDSQGKKLGFRFEDDKDIHLAIRDANGATMILEFPDPSCTVGAQHRYAMAKARAALIKSCGQPPTGHFRELHGTATITGVLFFDFPHHQRGHAPNFAELHPVLAFRSKNCSPSG